MSLAETVRDVAAAAGGLTGVGIGVKYVVGHMAAWLSKREERLGTEATASAAASREDDITAQHALKNERELMQLVRTLTKTLTDVQRELGEVKRELGTALANFANCEKRGDVQDGVIVRLKSRIEVLERRSNPPAYGAAE